VAWHWVPAQSTNGFAPENNRPRLGTAISLLGFVCWTSWLLVGVIANRRRSMTLKRSVSLVDAKDARDSAALQHRYSARSAALRAASDPMCRHTCLHEPFLNRKYSKGIRARFGLLHRGISIVRRVPDPNCRDFPGVEILPRSYDRDYWHRLMAQPGECDLRHAATGSFENRLCSRYHQRRAFHCLVQENSNQSAAKSAFLLEFW
jgi:hypothetical protein